jgi:hypothetical protein
MKHRLIAAAVAGLIFTSPAYTKTISVLAPGVLSAPAPFGPAATFDNETPTAWGSFTPTGPFSDGGALFSGGGIVMNNQGKPADGLYATPYSDTSNYMAVMDGRSETILYPTVRTGFGLYWGSVDTYNYLFFYNGGALVAAISGSDTGPLAADGDQIGYSANGYVLITSLPQFDKVVVYSAGNSFEFDNVVAFNDAAPAAPEASTWAMLLLGFVALALAGVTQRRALARL